MKRTFASLALLCALLFCTRASEAQNSNVTRQILLSDGTPATGAKALVRRQVCEKVGDAMEWRWSDLALQADAQGQITFKREQLSNNGFVMVDVPQHALAVWTHLYNDEKPLRLMPTFALRGVVLDENGKPLSGVKVYVRELSAIATPTLPLNPRMEHVSRPDLTAISGRDGSFTLRGMHLANHNPFDALTLSLTAETENGKTFRVGMGWLSIEQKDFVPVQPEPVKLVLKPLVAITGRVVNAFTQEPVGGAKIELQDRNPWGTPKSLITNADGRFSFAANPLIPQVEVWATHPELSYAKLIVTNPSNEARATAPVRDITLSLHPLATVTGRIVDAATGEPPVVPLTLSAVPQDNIKTGDNWKIIESERIAQTQEDGSFKLTASQRSNFLSIDTDVRTRNGSSMSLATLHPYNLVSSEMHVESSGRDGVLLQVRKQPGCLIRIEKNPKARMMSEGLKLQIRTPEGKIESFGWMTLFFWPTKDWGEQIEVSVAEFDKLILPWTPVVAAPHNWPLTIKLPE